jgi:hypothetical protein
MGMTYWLEKAERELKELESDVQCRDKPILPLLTQISIMRQIAALTYRQLCAQNPATFTTVDALVGDSMLLGPDPSTVHWRCRQPAVNSQ